MKKLILSFISAVIVFAIVFTVSNALSPEASASEITESGSCGNNVDWVLDADGTLTISGAGDMTSYPEITDPDAVKRIVFSSEITSISEWAFAYCSELEAVIFPENSKLETINKAAFVCCSSLKEVIIPASVKQINNAAFAACVNLTNVTFEDNSQLSELGSNDYFSFFYNGVFESCTSLTDIKIPATVKNIRCCAFAGCESLRMVSFEEGSQLEVIDAGAFRESAITEIVIPASVTTIEDEAFNGCMSLVSVSFEENSRLIKLGGRNYDSELTDGYSIDIGMFGHCEALKNISLPEEIQCIGAYVFNQCTALESLDLRMYDKLTHINNFTFASCKNLKEMYLPEGLISMGKGVFLDCESLTEIVIPDNVDDLYKLAFSGCISLSKVIFSPNSNLKEIADSAFSSCVELSEIRLPETLTYIGDYAFESCRKLDKIRLPEKVEYVGAFAFAATAIKEMHIPAAVSYFGTTFNFIEGFTVDPTNEHYCTDENGVLYSKDKTVLVQYPADLELKEFAIPDGVRSIGQFAFALCRNLEKLTMPDSVTEIQDAAFCYSFWIKEIVMSQKIETIGNSAFALCFSLKELDIPATVTEVADYTFGLLFSLESVRIYNTTLDFSNTELGLLYFTDNSEVDRQEICDLYIDMYYYYTCYDLEYINAKYGSEEALLEILSEFEDKMNNTLRTDMYTVYCYEGAAVEEYLNANNIKYKYFCDHAEETIAAVEPDCTQTGLTEGVKCSECGEILVEQKTVAAKGHTSKVIGAIEPEIGVVGYTGDTVCDVCGELLQKGEEIPAIEGDEEVIDCEHICHTTGVLRFLWKILNFFGKLFGVNSVCECGAVHY